MHSLTRIGSLAATGVALVIGAASAQRDISSVEIETVHVAGNIYMLVGAGGNIGVSVGDDGPFVVDDQFAPLTPKIQAAIAALTTQPVKFVMNTHWHGDHTGGNENFGKAGAMIVAHQNVRMRLNPDEFRQIVGRSGQAPPDALPVVTFTDQVNFYWNDTRIHAVHTEHAHTDGDAIVHFMGPNVIHMGDTFFNGRYPFIDMNSGGGINGIIHAANEGLSLANSDTRIIPGHGALATSVELTAYRNMLETVRDRVRRMLNDGRTQEEIVASDITADLDDDWNGSNGRDRFVNAVVQSLR